MLDIKETHSNIIAEKLLNWYDQNARKLPWRIPPKSTEIPDPYHIWLSEIMLQQTQVATVIDYFLKFIKQWPTIYDLAAATNDAVMHAWAGLGYYSRARNLHHCAKIIADDLGGEFPKNEAALQALPGVGPYTSAAICSIAFNKMANVIDGNIERVMARYLRFEDFLPKAKKALLVEIEHFISPDRPGDYAQALMDLGANICTPKKPKCETCPLVNECLAFKNDKVSEYPRKLKRAKIPHRFGTLYMIKNDQGEVAIERRPETGMLGGLYGFPTSDWTVENIFDPKKHTHITHVFTHFKLTLKIEMLSKNEGYRFVHPQNFAQLGFPKLMQKAFAFL